MRLFSIASSLIGFGIVVGISAATAAPRIDLNDLRNPHAIEPIHAARFVPAHADKTDHPINRPVGFDVLSYEVNIAVNPVTHGLAGTNRVTLTSRIDNLQEVTLDAVDMQIVDVLDAAGEKLEFFYDKAVLGIRLASPLAKGAELSLTVHFDAAGSQSLFLTGPDASDQSRMVAAYTYTQPLGSRFWYPCLDRPGDKALLDITVSVPEPLKALSNGHLLGTRTTNGMTSFHYRMDQPISTYLVSLAIGEYEVISIGNFGHIPLTVWTPPAIRDKTLNETERTERMLEVFSQFTGTRYPFGSYAQSVAQAWGSSMEHQSVTTMGGMRITGDKSGEGVVAHELAHQWFGDHVTCEIWEELWLNEGFATYLPMVFSTAVGDVDAALNSFDWWRAGYFDESKTMVRPLSADDMDPEAIFDSHSYEKGGLVIHMMRNQARAMRPDTAVEPFTLALQTYFRKNGGGNVRNFDLQQALEEVTGQSWQTFFNQWVRSAGHPILQINYRALGNGLTEVNIEQVQATRTERTWRSFSFPLELEIFLADGSSTTTTVDVYNTRRTVTVAGDAIALQADPRWLIPAEISIAQGPEAWTTVLGASAFTAGRVSALRQLAEVSPQVTDTILNAALLAPSSYLLASALETWSGVPENRAAIEAAKNALNALPNLELYPRGALARAEAWLVKSAPDSPTRADEALWQGRFVDSPYQYERAALIDMLNFADVERAQQFALAQLQRPDLATRDQRMLIEQLTNRPATPTSQGFIDQVLNGQLSLYFLRYALGNLIGQDFVATSAGVDAMLVQAQTNPYFDTRASYISLLAKQTAEKDKVCAGLATIAQPERVSSETWLSVSKALTAARTTLACP